MRTYHRLETANFVASGRATVKFNTLPSGKQGVLVPYLTMVEMFSDIAITVGNGGQAVTSLQWKNLLASLTFNVGGPWGPVNLNGEQLEETAYLQRAEPQPFASDTAGDTQAANNAGAITRKVRTVYDFEGFGPPDSPFDFCPPCERFRTGEAQMTFSALPTNTSAATISYSPIAHVVWRSEEVSVARIKSIAKALVGANQSITESGLLLRLFLQNTTADAVAGDFTGFRLFKDGAQIMEIGRPLDYRAKDYNHVGKVTSSQIQETGCDPIGGNFVRAINLYPLDGPRQRLGDLPVGDNWRYDYDGAPTVANWQVHYTIAYQQDEEHVVTSLKSAGGDVDGLKKRTDGGKTVAPTHVLVPKGPNNSVLTSVRLKGFVPVMLKPRESPHARISMAMGTHGIGAIGK